MMLPSSPVFQIKRDFCQILQFGVFHWLRVHSTIGIEYGKNEGTEMNESRLNTSFNKYRQCWTFASFEVMILVCTQCNSIAIDVIITTTADLINMNSLSQVEFIQFMALMNLSYSRQRMVNSLCLRRCLAMRFLCLIH